MMMEESVVKVAVLKERRPGETRVAATPETVKKMVALGMDVTLEKDAGLEASYNDEAYKAAGAKIATNAANAVKGADVVLKVRAPLGVAEDKVNEMGMLPEKALLIGMLAPHNGKDALQAYAREGVSTLSLELIPRITRAQSMDVLSSQSNLSGYRAVLEATNAYGRSFPMMMTAAGTVPAARVLIIGAGVAGLQAIATARRLGAIVSAFDVRAAAKEQVESLGAKFIEVEADEAGEGQGGYAKEMSEDYKKRQAERMAEVLKTSDIVITTALIPGKPAPRLVTKAMIATMKPGSILVDMAIESGGNVEGAKADKVVDIDGVKIIAPLNLAGRLAAESSALYSRNVLSLLNLIYDAEKKSVNLNFEDEIIQASVLTHGGKIVHPAYKS